MKGQKKTAPRTIAQRVAVRRLRRRICNCCLRPSAADKAQ